MNRLQKLVSEFNIAIGSIRGKTPGIRDAELRARLIEEEAAETAAALRAGDLVEAIDGLCDLLYVTYGAADTLGIDLDPFFNEVHDNNLTKINGPIDEYGKRLKPPDWKPPRIAEILERLKEDA